MYPPSPLQTWGQHTVFCAAQSIGHRSLPGYIAPNTPLPAPATEGAVSIWPSLLPLPCFCPSIILSPGMPRDAVLPLEHRGLSWGQKLSLLRWDEPELSASPRDLAVIALVPQLIL